MIKTVSDEDMMSVFLSDLVLANAWVTGTAWIVGMFVVLWYILKTARNRAQVASLSSINRALALYLEMPDEERDVS